jgi:methionyl-tRNA formyltransferase
MAHLRLVFMGTPDFAVPALRSLLGAGHEVVAVYCQPPRPAGRGQAERRAPVHGEAASRRLNVLTPADLKDEAVQTAFAGWRADAAVVAAYGLILPPAMLAAPRLGCLNIHASLLPRWRGAAPIQRAILAGDSETGVTIMAMDEGLDTGDILLAEKLPIAATATAGDLHDRLAALGAGLINEALAGVDDGTIDPRPQPEVGATYAAKIGPADGKLDWRQGAAVLERRVRALSPAPGAWFEHEGVRIKVLAAEIAEDGAGAQPGHIIDDRLSIACAEGALRPTRLQRPGRAAMAADEFLRGYGLAKGSDLSGPGRDRA